MIIRIGYSGSRYGMTVPQMRAVYAYLCGTLTANDRNRPVLEGHHGDCTGGDAEFHVIATVLGARTVAHPPLNPRYRAGCKADEIRPPQGYLRRDWNIASETGELHAAPKSPVPDPHSGTWITAMYAVQLGRPAKIWMPDGTMRMGSDFWGAWQGAS
jgi:hypothetical protein